MFEFHVLVHILIFLYSTNSAYGFGSYTFENPIVFPYGPIQGPFIGIFLALSLPLEIPHQSIFFSYNVEANYVLPQNATEFTYPPTLERTFKRASLYKMLEYKLKSHGYSSRSCLLRIICEVSQYSSQYTGILGDLLHLFFVPSSSVHENFLEEYEEAENYSKKNKHCKKYSKKCSVSLIGFISIVKNFLENSSKI